MPSLKVAYHNFRRYWRTYGTMNNTIAVIVFVVVCSWIWGSISAMQTNFTAQRTLDKQKQKLELTQLQVDTLKYQQNYYKSDEYKDLAAREYLGLAAPGEKVLILPANSAKVQQEEKTDALQAHTSQSKKPSESNLAQWFNFFSGHSAGELHEEQ